MNKPLVEKVKGTVRRLREVWPSLEGAIPFIGFSTGKDSLAMAAMIYEALAPHRIPCVYSHHNLEFATNLEYLRLLADRGFATEVTNPFLEYFELMDRGIGFLTLKDPWCVPMLVGTALLEWLKYQGAMSPRQGLLFRGMSGSEYSRKFHSEIELYRRLDLPCFNPMLRFTKEEIIEIIKKRYGLPLNPIYEHMDRTYCICCYTSDRKRQAYSAKHYPDVCARYYGQIEQMLFGTGLIRLTAAEPRYLTREEKIGRHGFVYWRRLKAQNVAGAVKRRLSLGGLSYHVTDAAWIDTKHLRPLQGSWIRTGNEIRFWNTEERLADAQIKRMINCLDCGFCMVECFPCRRFDRRTKTLHIDGCVQCGNCVRLKFCMGWKHRFWRRIIIDGGSSSAQTGLQRGKAVRQSASPQPR